MKTFKSQCGCELHVIRWSSRADCVTVKHCPLHKAAPDLLAALQNCAELLELLDQRLGSCGPGDGADHKAAVVNPGVAFALQNARAAIAKATGGAV